MLFEAAITNFELLIINSISFNHFPTNHDSLINVVVYVKNSNIFITNDLSLGITRYSYLPTNLPFGVH